MWIDVGGRQVPAFRSMGVVGFQAGVVLAILTSLRNGLSLATALGLSAVAAASFFAWGMLRRAVAGGESLVLLEHVWVGFAFVYGYARATEIDVATAFDVFSTSVALFLAFGRLGCLTAGCCHGTPAATGVRYSTAHQLPPRLVGRRLRPVQLYEATGLIAIAAVSLWLAGHSPGTATIWFLASYATLRFGTEALRGDQRPHIGPVSVARLMCGAQIAVAVLLSEAWLIPGSPDRSFWIAATLLLTGAASGSALALLRSRNELGSPQHLDEVWQLVTQAKHHSTHADGDTAPLVVETSHGMTVATSVQDSYLHVSLGHPTAATAPVARALAAGAVLEREGVSHFLVDLGPSSVDATIEAPVSGYFAPRPSTLGVDRV